MDLAVAAPRLDCINPYLVVMWVNDRPVITVQHDAKIALFRFAKSWLMSVFPELSSVIRADATETLREIKPLHGPWPGLNAKRGLWIRARYDVLFGVAGFGSNGEKFQKALALATVVGAVAFCDGARHVSFLDDAVMGLAQAVRARCLDVEGRLTTVTVPVPPPPSPPRPCSASTWASGMKMVDHSEALQREEGARSQASSDAYSESQPRHFAMTPSSHDRQSHNEHYHARGAATQLSVDEWLFTQESCADRFSDSRNFEALVQQVDAGEARASSDDPPSRHLRFEHLQSHLDLSYQQPLMGQGPMLGQQPQAPYGYEQEGAYSAPSSREPVPTGAGSQESSGFYSEWQPQPSAITPSSHYRQSHNEHYHARRDIIELPVDELFFTQKSCKSQFWDGRSFETLIRQLDAGEINPRTASFLLLEVVAVHYRRGGPPIYHSLDNRRLYCLKKYQENCRARDWTVYVRAKIRQVPYEDRKIAERWQLYRNGQEIIVRRDSLHY